MSELKLNIPHALGENEALKRIQQMLGNLKTEQKDKITNLKEDWQGNTNNFSFSAQGFDLAGLIKVNPSSVDFDAKLPFALSFFKGKISEMIERKAAELLK